MCIYLGRAYFKARGIKKDSVSDMIEIEITNIPVKSGIVYPDVDGFLCGPVRPWSSLPSMLMLSGVEL